MAHYLNAEKFTAYFRGSPEARIRNRRRIAAGLFLIADHARLTFDGPWDVVEDAAADALFLAITSLDKFDARRRNAFAYFWTLINRQIAERIEMELRRRGRFVQLAETN